MAEYISREELIEHLKRGTGGVKMKAYRVEFNGSVSVAADSLEEAEEKFIDLIESVMTFEDYDNMEVEAFDPDSE